MTHPRKRYLIDIIKHKLEFSSVVAIQGARQTGKSFLARNLLSGAFPQIEYRTLDKAAEREFAQRAPDTYLAQYADARPLVIDEAQKAPRIFDAVKLAVDERRTPGRFLLLGSTEFSKLLMIRESLTGRMSRARLFPFTLTESLHKAATKSRQPFFVSPHAGVSREEMMRFLWRGGLPGIFAVHEKREREGLLTDWIDLTVERDIHLFPKARTDSDLARRILQGVACLEHPDLASLVSYCRRDSRIVGRHIQMLKTLFVLEELPAHPLGTGKSIYFMCDVALAAALGASFERLIYTWALNELLAKRACLDEQKRTYFYYRNSKGSTVEILEEDGGELSALKILYEERALPQDFYLLRALKKKAPRIRLFALGAGRQSFKEDGIEMFAWECLA